MKNIFDTFFTNSLAFYRGLVLFQEITLWRKGEKQRKSNLQSPQLPMHLVNNQGNLIEDSPNTVANDITPNAGSSESESNENPPPERTIEHMRREEADGETASNDNNQR